MSVTLARRHFTVEEYERMARAGVLGEDDRLELIQGEIIEMSPIGSEHAACVKRLNDALSRKLGKRALIGVQDPILLSDISEPQPDISVLHPRADFYAEAHPKPADVFLLIEVADTTIEYDTEVKVPLYAAAEIHEVWIVDLSSEVITRHSQPRDGSYQDTRTVRRGESLESVSLPVLTLRAEEILG